MFRKDRIEVGFWAMLFKVMCGTDLQLKPSETPLSAFFSS